MQGLSRAEGKGQLSVVVELKSQQQLAVSARPITRWRKGSTFSSCRTEITTAAGGQCENDQQYPPYHALNKKGQLLSDLLPSQSSETRHFLENVIFLFFLNIKRKNMKTPVQNVPCHQGSDHVTLIHTSKTKATLSEHCLNNSKYL